MVLIAPPALHFVIINFSNEICIKVFYALVTPRPDVPDKTMPDDARRSQTKKIALKKRSGSVWYDLVWFELALV